jgi:hypothetical protein
VISHEARGAERHQQVIGAIHDLKIDYRTMLAQQTADAKADRDARFKEQADRMALYGKIALGILGIVSTVVAGIYGLTPPIQPNTPPTTQTAPPATTPAPDHGP